MASNAKSTQAKRKPADPPHAVTVTRTKNSLLVTIKLVPQGRADTAASEPSDPQEAKSPVKASPAPSAAAVLPPLAPSNEANSDSNPATPGANTSAPSAMGPPGEKKKIAKRAAPPGTADPTARVRAKPGPKKKPRLDDGEIPRPVGGHKLGPKANMGAINAGLRALDRSGKPSRRWSKGGFTLKTFTGVVWEIPCWKTASSSTLDGAANSDSAVASTGSSAKENMDSNQGEVLSTSGANGKDVDMGGMQESASTPVAIAAAS